MQLRDNYKVAFINNGCTTASIATDITAGSGSLIAITVGGTGTGAIDIVDGSPGSSNTPTMGSLSVAEGTYWFLSGFANGLKIVQGCPGKVSVIYDPHTNL